MVIHRCRWYDVERGWYDVEGGSHGVVVGPHDAGVGSGVVVGPQDVVVEPQDGVGTATEVPVYRTDSRMIRLHEILRRT